MDAEDVGLLCDVEHADAAIVDIMAVSTKNRRVIIFLR